MPCVHTCAYKEARRLPYPSLDSSLPLLSPVPKIKKPKSEDSLDECLGIFRLPGDWRASGRAVIAESDSQGSAETHGNLPHFLVGFRLLAPQHFPLQFYIQRPSPARGKTEHFIEAVFYVRNGEADDRSRSDVGFETETRPAGSDIDEARFFRQHCAVGYDLNRHAQRERVPLVFPSFFHCLESARLYINVVFCAASVNR